MEYRLSADDEKSLQQAFDSDPPVRERAILRIVQRIAESAHADGCRETVARVRQASTLLERELYVKSQVESHKEGHRLCYVNAAQLVGLRIGAALVAPSRVKEAPTPEMKHAYFLSHVTGPTYGHWVCECGKDLGDCPLDEIDEVFQEHVKQVTQPSDAAEREISLIDLKVNRTPIAHFMTNGNAIWCNQYWALGMDCQICNGIKRSKQLDETARSTERKA